MVIFRRSQNAGLSAPFLKKKIIERRENHGKMERFMDNHRKMGKSWENHRKIWETEKTWDIPCHKWRFTSRWENIELNSGNFPGVGRVGMSKKPSVHTRISLAV